MKQTWKVMILILTCLIIVGCDDGSSQRLADMAERTARMQAEQNVQIARTRQEHAKLQRDIQLERRELNRQLQALEIDRRDLHDERRSELAWAESFRFLAIVIAAAMPLFLCAYLIWASTRNTGSLEAVNEILIQEFVSPKPRLIAAPNLPAIEHKLPSMKKSSTNKGGPNKDVTHRPD